MHTVLSGKDGNIYKCIEFIAGQTTRVCKPSSDFILLGGRNEGQGASQGGGYQQRPQGQQPNQGGQQGAPQGGYQSAPNPNANQQRPQNNQQAGNKPPPMAEPDFDFDDDIPF
uniref:hypothetical protein n=1 Tax=Ningiella ruwaisensis TaxID=2364274 RepID=UPI0015D2E6F7